MITKQAQYPNFGINLDQQFTVTVDIPANATYENLTVIDTIPIGMDFRSFVSATCTSDGDGCVPITNLARTFENNNGGLEEFAGWYIDSVPLSGEARTLTFVYTARVTGNPALLTGFTNSVDVMFNVVDRLGGVVPRLSLIHI